MSLDSIISEAEIEFKKALDHLKDEYSHLQIGRASVSLVDSLMVESYGTRQPMKAVANISIPDAKTVQIQPWDKGQLQSIEKAIQTSGINLTPSNDGVVIRINIPPLTEERRKDLAKVVHRLAEEGKISIRSSRQAAMDQIKAMEKSKEITEDFAKGSEKRLQEKVDHCNREIEALSKKKEEEITKI